MALLILVGIPVARVVVEHGHDPRRRQRHVHPHELLDEAEFGGLAGQQHNVGFVVHDSLAVVEQQLVEDVVDHALKLGLVQQQVELLLGIVVSRTAELVERLLERIDHGGVDDFGVHVGDRQSAAGSEVRCAAGSEGRCADGSEGRCADVVHCVVQIGLGQRHEQPVDPAQSLGADLAVAGDFGSEEQLHVFVFQAQGVGKRGDDDRLQQSFDQLVSSQVDSVLVEDLAADGVVDLGLEVVLGDHQVGGPPADVYAGNADLVGRVAELFVFFGGRPFDRARAVNATASPAAGGTVSPAAGGTVSPAAGGTASPTPSGGGAPDQLRPWLLLRLLRAAVLVQGGKPEPGVLAQQTHLAPDVGQVYGAGLVDAEVQLGPGALTLAQRVGKDVDGLVDLGLQATLLLLDHAAGITEGEGADFAGSPGVARGTAVGRGVDVAVCLGEKLVDGRGHHAAWGVAGFQRRVVGEFVLGGRFLFEQEIAVVFVHVPQQRTLERGGVGSGAATVGRVGHVPVGALEPTGVVGPKVSLGRAQPGADIALGTHHLCHVVGLTPQADHGEVVEQRRGDHDFDLALLGFLAAAEPPWATLTLAHGMELGLLLHQGGQEGRVAPVCLGGEPAGRRHAGRLALLVPGVEVIAVGQFEGQHLRRLADLSGQLQQQHARAAVAEIDDHVDVLGVAGHGRGGTDTEFDFRCALQRFALHVEQPGQVDREIPGQGTWLAEVPQVGVAAGGVDRQEHLGGARLDNLPLDEGVVSGRFVFGPAAALAALPAVSDLGGLIAAAAAERDANDLDPGVCEQYVHVILPC